MAAAIAVAGCSRSASRSVAVGAQTELSRSLGPCMPVSSAPLRFSSGYAYEAIAPGTARISCRDGTQIIDVRRAVRLEIDPAPSAPVGAHLAYRASAFDASGVALELGSHAPLTWSFGGALVARPNPGCGDILPLCAPASGGYAVAAHAGAGTIAVAFGALRATSTTMVAP